MSSVNVNPQSWAMIFDKDTSGSFRIHNFKGTVLRAPDTPTEGGLNVDSDKNFPSEMFTYVADGVNNLYVYNRDTEVGTVQKDI